MRPHVALERAVELDGDGPSLPEREQRNLGDGRAELQDYERGDRAILREGCSGPRCTPQSGTPYGGRPGRPWAGPHATVQAAVIEWIKDGTFNWAKNGRFTVNESGVVTPSP